MSGGPIPRLLHAVWVGPPMPGHLEANLREWARLHPHWHVKLWRDADLAWLANRAIYDRADALVPADAVGQFRADIARYEILHRHGGLYVDCDTRPLRCVDDALVADTFAAAEDEHWVGNTYLGAVPDHPVMAALVGGIRANLRRRRPGWRANRLSGPRYLTPIWREHGAHVAPRELFFPYNYADVKAGAVPEEFAPDVYAVHEWRHTRDVMAQRKEAVR